MLERWKVNLGAFALEIGGGFGKEDPNYGRPMVTWMEFLW